MSSYNASVRPDREAAPSTRPPMWRCGPRSWA